MRGKLFAFILLAGLAAALTPTEANAYGAVHVGYTHVGPNGVSHVSETAVAGPGGVREVGHTTAVGYGGAYAGGVRVGAGGAAYGTRVYAPTYHGAVGYSYYR